MTTPSFNSIVDDAAQPYANVSRYAYHFTRNKLRYDPVFRALLQRGLLPDHGHFLDLGCGLGVLPALLHEARNHIVSAIGQLIGLHRRRIFICKE